ncbi:MAG: efflux transporter outer membrane subunit [Deltaproteobacteria bacterium]|nr:efflux transporter outer membrane subunit [Deltaproteobacteria bacterium]MDQ3296851.1 efflux transporter outer membrane subunit [Myxococcota bacterium]
MRRATLIISLAGMALGSGCSLAPRYERPAAPIASTWGDAGTGRTAAELGWRDVFSDPRLQRLIELALRNNRDLRVAALNVELARAQYRIERAAQLPTLGAGGGVEFRGTTDDIGREYRVGLGLSYELDLFGRVKNLKAAALESYLATVEARRGAHLALVSEIATQYLAERAFDEQLALAKRTLELVTQSSEVTQRLFEQGQRSELDVRTTEAQIQGARAEVARVTRLRVQAENALVMLVGVRALPAGLPAAQPLETQPVVAELSAGVPSEVLLRRPDVLAAEHALRAANANIGVARAAFFPSISLTGFGGLASTTLRGLVSGGALLWTASADLSQPLFTGGRLSATLDVAQVRKQIEVVRYEQAIQNAFREVADALGGRAALDEQLAAQLARVAAEERRFAISETRYRAGIENYLTVLTAQRDLFVAQQQLIETRLTRLTNLVRLYAALGGGWREGGGVTASSSADPPGS